MCVISENYTPHQRALDLGIVQNALADPGRPLDVGSTSVPEQFESKYELHSQKLVTCIHITITTTTIRNKQTKLRKWGTQETLI